MPTALRGHVGRVHLKTCPRGRGHGIQVVSSTTLNKYGFWICEGGLRLATAWMGQRPSSLPAVAPVVALRQGFQPDRFPARRPPRSLLPASAAIPRAAVAPRQPRGAKGTARVRPAIANRPKRARFALSSRAPAGQIGRANV